MRLDRRGRPETRTARQLINVVRKELDDVRKALSDLDEPTTNQGAIAIEKIPHILEAAYQTTFAATAKLTEGEQLIPSLEKALKRERRKSQRTKGKR